METINGNDDFSTVISKISKNADEIKAKWIGSDGLELDWLIVDLSKDEDVELAISIIEHFNMAKQAADLLFKQQDYYRAAKMYEVVLKFRPNSYEIKRLITMARYAEERERE
jgi:hypothetical protein